MKILITGCAGFIGFHLSKKLISNGYIVYGVDKLNNYYDINLKKKRLEILNSISRSKKNFIFKKIDISIYSKLKNFFKNKKIDVVVNLAAQAGVRYSIKKPEDYFKSNVLGFFNILQAAKNFKIKHLLYASTSSVYGNSKKMPFSEESMNCKPIQFYAATKISNESMAISFSNIYGIKTTGFRFFTVYGPWGRPDMALFKFSKNIFNNKPVEVFNYGKHSRDLTYVDDIVSGIEKSIKKKTNYIHEVFNLGNNKSIGLEKILKLLKKNYKKKFKIKYFALQKGDIKDTKSNIFKAKKILRYFPKTSPEVGIKKFCKWFVEYNETL